MTLHAKIGPVSMRSLKSASPELTLDVSASAKERVNISLKRKAQRHRVEQTPHTRGQLEDTIKNAPSPMLELALKINLDVVGLASAASYTRVQRGLYHLERERPEQQHSAQDSRRANAPCLPSTTVVYQTDWTVARRLSVSANQVTGNNLRCEIYAGKWSAMVCAQAGTACA
jgi:hypothetical protein